MALWTPSNLATAPSVWIRVEDVTWSGSNFSSCTNLGSTGGSFSNESGTVTKTATVWGTYDALTFSGSNNLHISTNKTDGSGEILCAAVYKLSAASTGIYGVASWGWNVAGTNGRFACYAADGSTSTKYGVCAFWQEGSPGFAYRGAADYGASYPSYVDTTNSRIGVWKFGSTSPAMRVDGTAQTLDQSDTNTRQNLSTASKIRVGRAAASEYFAGVIGEVLFFVVTGTSEIEQVEGYLAWKYGLQSQLPGGHTYSGAAPTISSPQNATPSFISATGGTFNPTLTSRATVSPSFISATGGAFNPTLTPGGVNLNISFISATGGTFNPTLTSLATVSPSFISATGQAYAVTLTAVARLNPSFIAATGGTFSPSLSPGAASVSPGYLAATGQAYAVSLNAVARLNPNFVPAGGGPFACSATPGNVNLPCDYIGPATQIYPPTLNQGQSALTGITMVPRLNRTNNLGYITHITREEVSDADRDEP